MLLFPLALRGDAEKRKRKLSLVLYGGVGLSRASGRVGRCRLDLALLYAICILGVIPCVKHTYMYC